MSAKKPAPLRIAVDAASKRPVVITDEGTEYAFTAQFDDLTILRDLFTVNRTVAEIGKADLTTEAKLAKLMEVSTDAQKVIDAILGAGASASIFGEGALPFMRVLKVVTGLANAAGPVYDSMLAEYLPQG